MLRNLGRFKFYTGPKLTNGMIRNNHQVLEFSDRDMTSFLSPVGFRPIGKKRTNLKLIEMCDNFRPDLLVLGHCDIITEKTLQQIRRLIPQIKIVHWFLDALWIPRNVARIKSRMHSTDAIFVTTGGTVLKQFCTGRNLVGFIPNPTDLSWERHNNATKNEFERDLLFCGGGNKTDSRYGLLKFVQDNLDSSIKFESFGIVGNPSVWGQWYDKIISTSKMALNLNREENWFFYSSDRISQLLGNGLLTFIWDKGEMRRLFSDDQVVFFRDRDELIRKIVDFQENDLLRKHIAKNGYNYYHNHFSAQCVARYMIETTFGTPFTREYLWQDELYQ